jgi:hypothetical protein
VYPVTRKRDGPFRAGRVLQPQNSKLDHGGQCRALLVSTAKAKARTVYFLRKCLGKLREKVRREMVSTWRTTSVCHVAPLFYLAHCTQTLYSQHKLLESKFTHHTHVHAHTHGDYSHSLRSQTRYRYITVVQFRTTLLLFGQKANRSLHRPPLTSLHTRTQTG